MTLADADLRRAMLWVQRSPATDLRLPALAQALGLSPRTLARRGQAHTGLAAALWMRPNKPPPESTAPSGRPSSPHSWPNSRAKIPERSLDGIPELRHASRPTFVVAFCRRKGEREIVCILPFSRSLVLLLIASPPDLVKLVNNHRSCSKTHRSLERES